MRTGLLLALALGSAPVAHAHHPTAVIGQSLSAWQTAYGGHGHDLGPMVNDHDGRGHEYRVTTSQKHRLVDDVNIYLPTHTTLTGALKAVGKILPKDTQVTTPMPVFQTDCATWNVTSTTAAHTLASTGDTEGVLGITFTSVDTQGFPEAFDFNDVEIVNVSIAPNTGTC